MAQRKPQPQRTKRVVRRKKKIATRHASGLLIRDANLDRARPFKWAWEQRVLRGYLNLQIGEEGIGKGNLTAWVAARITRGELEGDLYGKPAKVAFIGDEDAWDHIWVPRLSAAGADLSLVSYIESGATGVLDVEKDASALRDYITTEGIVLVYFDQLLDNLGYADSWKDKEIRDKLAPLKRVAQETGCALLASMHPNKRQGSFRDRISGSPAFNALSRSSLLIAAHPDEPGRVAVVRGKGNYSVEPPAFEFRIEEQSLIVKGRTIKTSRIANQRETDLRSEDILGQRTTRETSQASQARARLSELFANGEIRPAKETLEQMEAEGFPERVTQEARRNLGIETWQEGFQGPWSWGHRRPTQPKATKRRRK
jgi:hypothetical protein